MSRSYTFGEVGVSASQFYAVRAPREMPSLSECDVCVWCQKYLKPIRLNDKAVDWAKFELRSDVSECVNACEDASGQ